MNQLLFVFTQTPGSINAQEGFDALLMGSAFSTCSALFLGDAIYQLLADQDPSTVGSKNYSMGFAALADYGVTDIYCSASQQSGKALTAEDFVIPLQALDDLAVRQLFVEHQTVLNF
jgi:tRNA 2-thiouridine synthesizing protein C